MAIKLPARIVEGHANQLNADYLNGLDTSAVGGTAGGDLTGTYPNPTIGAGKVLNVHVGAAAAIAYSKLANLTSAHILVGSAGNVPTDTAVTGDVTINNTGVTAIGASKVTSSMVVDGTLVDGDLTANTLSAALPNWGTWFPAGGPVLNAGGSQTATANLAYFSQCLVYGKATLTGIEYAVGTTATGNVKAGLFNSAGTQVAQTTATLAQGTAGQPQKVPFSATLAVNPGIYFASLVFSSTANYWGFVQAAPTGTVAAGSFIIPASITVPTASAFVNMPSMTTY